MEKHRQPAQRHQSYEDFEKRRGARDLLNAPAQYLRSVPIDERLLEAPTVADPMFAVIRTVGKQLFDEVVIPTLAAQTRDELFNGLSGRWGKFHTTMSALITLLMTTPAGVALVNVAKADKDGLAGRARKIAGDAAADEVAFSESTYMSAVRITERFTGLPAPGNVESDQRMALKFSTGSSLHTLGSCMIGAIAGGERATPVGIEVAFELLRSGALEAYVAARTALSLRQDADANDDSSLPVDDEDVALLQD